MPTYEFTCKACGHHFEIFTTMSKKSGIVCDKCGCKKLQEAYGAFFVGGNVSNPSAGAGTGCDGNCTGCGSSCKK